MRNKMKKQDKEITRENIKSAFNGYIASVILNICMNELQNGQPVPDEEYEDYDNEDEEEGY
jgi:hypothetical protein